MKHKNYFKRSIAACFFIFIFMAEAVLAENIERSDHHDISKRMESIINTHISLIEIWAKDLQIIQATKKQNQKDIDIAEIKRIDKDWVNGKIEHFISELLNNSLSRYLSKKVQSNSALYVEAFLCDKKGALVGAYPQTSDYWQGDEDKFIKSFNNGSGHVYVGSIEYDESVKMYSVQLSVPVLDEQKTIGVLVVGLKNIK